VTRGAVGADGVRVGAATPEPPEPGEFDGGVTTLGGSGPTVCEPVVVVVLVLVVVGCGFGLVVVGVGFVVVGVVEHDGEGWCCPDCVHE
jgi:hypothetical protein